MNLKIDLELIPYTNIPFTEVSYTIDNSERVKKFECPRGFANINNIPSHDKYFFISHKIPTDTRLARRLDYYLRKIGFWGYVAEAIPQPGQSVWEEKLFPKIEECTGVIVLWTREAKGSPESIDREVRRARKYDKRVMSLIEGESIPDVVANQPEEYIMTSGPITESSLVKLVHRIRMMYEDGTF